MLRFGAAVFGASAIVAGLAAPAAAQGVSAFGQFSLAANPNGAWSYLAGGTLLDKTLNPCSGVTKFQCWWNGGSLPNSAIVGANRTGKPISYYTIVLPANYLALDPENASPVVVQYTAPAAATLLVAGNFLGVDTSEASHTVAVLHNGTVLKSFTMAAYKQKSAFRLKVPVAAGDTISFASYNNGFGYLSTGLQAKITPQ